ncbi:MAG: nicotinate (nicotinamide) nucleotide adenylyltransferase [Candidatus Dormibacteria bacterium]
MIERLGLLGGTFDPVHLGHLAVARQCREQVGLDRVLLVPSFLPPHRSAPSASADDRLAMARLAAEGVEGLEVDDVEVRRGGVSYAVDTVREMTSRTRGAHLIVLLGMDAAAEFASWRDPATILDLASVVVFNRAGVPAAGPSALPPGSQLLEVDSPAVSASGVRAALAAGEPVDGLLPKPVIEYIRARGLYGPAVA